MPSNTDLIACPSCDWLHVQSVLAPGEQARCKRCGSVMQTHKLHTVDRTLAASLAGVILLLVSLTLPFLSLTRSGLESHISVLDTVAALWRSDMRWMGLMTLSFIVLLPACRLSLLIWVTWRLRWGRQVRPGMRTAFRWALRIEPWAMADIFVVGVAISLVKIGSVATLSVGPAFWALLSFILVSVLISIVMCRDTLWKALTPTA